MSLVEVLLAITLMSIVVLGIAAGFQTTAKVSGQAGERASLQAALNSTTDRVAALAYPGCATAAQLTASAATAHVAPAGYSATIVGVTYLVPTGSCTANTSALMVSVQVTDVQNPSQHMNGDVVLRDPAARPA